MADTVVAGCIQASGMAIHHINYVHKTAKCIRTVPDYEPKLANPDIFYVFHMNLRLAKGKVDLEVRTN